MREAAEKLLATFKNFTSVAAPAEATTLRNRSVDFITCAQAFHWFEREKAKTEFTRILRPGGFIVLLWNERRVDTTPFLRGYEKLLHVYATDYRQVNHTQIDDEVLTGFFQPQGFQKHTFENRQLFDYAGLEGRLLSSSYAPPTGHSAHTPMLGTLRELFDAHQGKGVVSFDYDTNVYLSKV
jgi:SAM-dependent methyltransferase